jgi:biotin synthase
MCLTIPAKIIKINGAEAIIQDSQNQSEKISISANQNLAVGDWILHTTGQAIKKIEPTEAKQIIDLLEIAPYKPANEINQNIKSLLAKARQNTLNKQEVVTLLKTQGDEMKLLLSEANIIRQATLKDFFCIHGIIEFSNYCRNNCLYCGISTSNRELKRYRLSHEEIIQTAVDAVNNKGYKLLVLQSGEDLSYTADDLANIVKTIKKQCQVFIFISIGERDFETYEKLKKAGANGVLFRYETSNPEIYKFLHPQLSFEKRFEHLKWFQQLGYFIATGSLMGLPGQILEDIAGDILFFTENKFPMASFGPFIPNHDTSLEKSQPGDVDLILKALAIVRLLNPAAKIPVVTALESLNPIKARKQALQGGANSLMFNITPKQYQKLYHLYPNKLDTHDEVWEKYGLFKVPDSYDMLEKKLKNEL